MPRSGRADGNENHVKVYVGSDHPILHDYNDYLYEVQLGYFIHPEFATNTKGIWIDIYNTFDANYGKSVPYISNPVPTIPLLQESTVVFAVNTTEFYAFYVDLLTRPVPVKFVHPPPAHNLDD